MHRLHSAMVNRADILNSEIRVVKISQTFQPEISLGRAFLAMSHELRKSEF